MSDLLRLVLGVSGDMGYVGEREMDFFVVVVQFYALGVGYAFEIAEYEGDGPGAGDVWGSWSGAGAGRRDGIRWLGGGGG